MSPWMLLIAVDESASWSQQAITWTNQMLTGNQSRFVLAAVLLSLGCWCLQPGARRGRRFSGIVALLLGLAASVSLLGPLGFLPVAVAFRIVAGLCLFSAVATVTSRNPVYSAIWFALTLVGTAALMLLWGAQFVAIATVAVYAGAIVVTFLFVLMLAQSSGHAAYDRLTWGRVPAWLGAPIAVGIFLMIVVGISRWRDSTAVVLRDTLSAAVTQTLADLSATGVEAASREAASREAVSDTTETLQPNAATDSLNWSDGLRAVRWNPADDEAALCVELTAPVYQAIEEAGAAPRIRQSIADRLADRRQAMLQAEPNAEQQIAAVCPSLQPDAIALRQAGLFGDLRATDHVALLGGQLFTRYLIPVQIVATLLLAALIGAVAIASCGPGGMKGEGA